ncbi:helix-turn-helix transcriptional regulator [Pseudoflavonifractor phocaeensis]|nr:helix-turn-helix transcriptional regulator [Pseudoflavonifractor phocaeensis]
MMVTHSLLRVKGEAMFADRIRILRSERNLTQAEVAREVELSPRGYQDLELGRKPKYDTLLRLADFFDVSVDWLMGRTQRREVWK